MVQRGCAPALREELVTPDFPVSPVLGLLAAPEGHAAPGSFMDALPDPMKIDVLQIGAVILLVAVLYFILKGLLFRPVAEMIDTREAAMEAGDRACQEAAALVEQRQADYQSRLKVLRAQAFEQKKALSEAANQERQRLVEAARTQAQAERSEALVRMQAQREAAKGDLVAQVESLSESMVQQLLKA